MTTNPNTPNTSYGLRTRIAIWWVVKTPRQQARIALIAGPIVLLAISAALPFLLAMYLWCVVITGWGLYIWTRKHPMSKQNIILWLIFGAAALFIILALIIIAASGTNDNRRGNNFYNNNFYNNRSF
jgi:hypothetical protein